MRDISLRPQVEVTGGVKKFRVDISITLSSVVEVEACRRSGKLGQWDVSWAREQDR